MFDKNLVRKSPSRDDELRCVIDLLYSLKQSLIFLRYKHDFIKTDEERIKIASEMSFGRLVEEELLRHNAYLESTLINIRAIDEFFKPETNIPRLAADIRFKTVFKKAPSSKLMSEDDLTAINQLFAHITANRNTVRAPKQNFDLVKLVENVFQKFEEILAEASKQPIKQELENCYPLPYVMAAMCETLRDANRLLILEKNCEGQPEFRKTQFNVSGSNQIEEI